MRNPGSPAFTPRGILKNPHLQTLLPTLLNHTDATILKKERFELPDSDFVDCYWHTFPEERHKSPIITLFHGLAGSWRSPYIRRAMRMLGNLGYSVVLMHFRGCSGSPNRLPCSYHSGDTADAKIWLEALNRRYPTHPLYGVGYSLGANMLLKLLGEWQESTLLQKAVAVSAPMQLDLCADRMNQGFSRLYQKHLLHHLKRDLLQKYDRFDMERIIGLKRAEVHKLNSFWEFDDAYTAPVHGFANAAEYYQQSSARQYLRMITIPTTIIHALDDPFMTPDVLPHTSELAPSVDLKIFDYVGFVEGSIHGPHYRLEALIADALSK